MLQRLSLLWKRFTPLEERLLAEVRAVLPDTLQPVFDGQVAVINRVQRLPPAWSEIAFYCLRFGKVDWSRAASFPCTDEMRLAEVRFKVAGRGYRAVLSSIEGHIFDFTFTPGPRAVAFSAWDATPRATLLGDPLRAPTGRKEAEPLPAEWQAFLARRSGRTGKEWALHDAATARRVALEDGEYWILAERAGDEFILHRLEPPGDGLLHLRGHDAVPEPIRRSLDHVLGYDKEEVSA